MQVAKRFDSMRLNDEEAWEAYEYWANRVVPKDTTEDVDLISATDTLEEAEHLMANAGSLVGLSTGYPTIDAMTKGMAPGDLCIVFGDTSHGKSQFTQNITYNIARSGQPVLFIGLEMTNPQNTTRFIAIANAHGHDMAALQSIMYPKSNDLSYGSMEPHIARAVADGAALVIIDQLQQLTRSVDNTANETSLICHEIKRMAVKYSVPIILISHINRTGQTGSAPTLRELKGSSSIEQDADMCIAVWRETDSRKGNPDLVEIWLRKNRNRGMQHTQADMYVQGGVRLVEADSILVS